jgi:hypothetical protein
LVVVAAAGPPITGCGGGSHEDNGEGSKQGEEGEQRQAEALDKIPVADQTAFTQLATAIGTLRARAAPVAVGTSQRLASAAPLLTARGQVNSLRPSDPRLSRLRGQLIPVLTRFSRAPTSGAAARRAARAAIADADRIEAGLRRYAQGSPAIGGLIPD